MGVCAIKLRRTGRRCLGTSLLIMNLVIVVCGLLMIIMGIVLTFFIREQRDLLHGFNYKVIVNFIFGMGATIMIVHLLACKVCNDCGSVKRCDSMKTFLLPLMAIIVVEMCCIIALAVESRKAIQGLTSGFERGFQALMDEYGTNLNKKQEIDLMQRKHHCCGSTGYKGWLDIEWYPNDFIRPEVQKSKSKDSKRGVPFSCCNPAYMGPCIHDVVEIKKPGYKLIKGRSFYDIGCGEGVMTSIKWILRMLSYWVFVPFWLEFFMIFMMKYLYTSVVNALDAGDPRGPGFAYMCKQCPCSCFEFMECNTDTTRSNKGDTTRSNKGATINKMKSKFKI